SGGKNVFIRQNSIGANTSNYASYTYLVVDTWTNGGDTQLTRSLLDFNLSSIPSGVTISKAILVLYADTTDVVYGGETKADNGHSTLSGPNNWLLERITSAWTESAVTWNTQPTIDTSINVPASVSRSQTYEIDVTNFIKDEIANPTLYYGFMLKLSNESPYRSLIFCSSRHQYSTLSPALKITYMK
ncbi:MAG TPA: DNRLRE domain-containing protein, partial [Cytophagaceae bacterium]|nr:DNRLRE domain-containing protein [Cytophagaceae bacterium]